MSYTRFVLKWAKIPDGKKIYKYMYFNFWCYNKPHIYNHFTKLWTVIFFRMQVKSLLWILATKQAWNALKKESRKFYIFLELMKKSYLEKFSLQIALSYTKVSCCPGKRWGLCKHKFHFHSSLYCLKRKTLWRLTVAGLTLIDPLLGTHVSCR